MALERVTIRNCISDDKIEVWCNPEEYTVQRNNTFAEAAVPGLQAPLLQFVNGNMQTLEMELLVDTYDTKQAIDAKQDVRQLTGQITALMDIDRTTHAPPVLIVSWGTFSFTCVLASASQRFIMFRPDGVPVRARLQVTFNQFANAELEAKEIKHETADYSRLHVVHEGETLSSIATQIYQNPTLWRPIAISNEIDDPQALSVGRQLLIPQLPFQDPATGEVMQ